ncbi:MAG: NAD(P)H-dependent oxidoreductase [Carboxylicivirga sp.]|jgi:putative NADPH-quinone reductase|nr:NAD(P)H-dependent oxidoreductase [Carboxylicivirga sp.]
MNKTIVICGHSNITSSIANHAIVEELSANHSNAEVRELIKLYPDFNINANAEQEALVNASNIVLQFPVQWFGIPAILKQWLDLVFAMGFAHGKGGDKLKGKKLYISYTTGIPQETYNSLPDDGFKIEHINLWFKQIADYTGMDYQGASAEYGMMPIGTQTKEQVVERAGRHAKALVARMV